MNCNRFTGGVTTAKGFKASGIHCGIRKNKEKPDLAMIFGGEANVQLLQFIRRTLSRARRLR